MKKMVLSGVTLLLVLGGCSLNFQPQTTAPTQDDSSTPTVTVEPTTPAQDASIKSKIENFNSYTLVADATEKSSVVASCDDYTKAYVEKVNKGDVKKLSLYESKDNLYDLRVYVIPNYDNLTFKDLKDKVGKCGELGSNFPLKTVNDNVIWGWSSCTGGAAPTKDQPGYDDFVKCTEVEKQLDTYLKS